MNLSIILYPCVKVYACLCTYVGSVFVFFHVFPNTAAVRAVTAYLQKNLTGLGCCAMENIPKPPVGVNKSRAFHAPTSLS